MKRTEFENIIINQTMLTLLNISKSKGQEYSRGEDDANSNFVRLAKELGMTPETILWVYAAKHIDSVVCFIKDTEKGNKRQLSEPIEGRIDDIIMYMMLLKGLIFDRQNGEFDGIPSHGTARNTTADLEVDSGICTGARLGRQHDLFVLEGEGTGVPVRKRDVAARDLQTFFGEVGPRAQSGGGQ